MVSSQKKTKGRRNQRLIKTRTSNKDGEYNDQSKNHEKQLIFHNSKPINSGNPINGGNPINSGCLGRVRNSYSTSDLRRVIVKRHDNHRI